MGWYLYGKADANMYGPPHQQGMNIERNDITNRGSRTVYRYHRNAINHPQHNDRLTTWTAHRPLPNRSSHFGQTH